MKKEKLYVPSMILQLIGVVVCLIMCTRSLAEGIVARSFQVNSIFVIIALIVSLIYFFLGARKQSVLFFRLFIWIFAISELSTVVSFAISNNTNPAVVGLSEFAFACIVVLALGSNLGKKKSYIFCAIICAVNFILALNYAFAAKTVATIYFGHAFSLLNLTLILWLMLVAKYVDKSERGSK